MANIQITTSEVPSTFCWTSPQVSWPFLVGLLAAETEGTSTSYTLGSSVPDPEDRGNPWIRLNSDGSFDKIYTYYNGLWISPHPVFTGAVIMYTGSEASIVTLDGGESGTVTTTSGPMWEKMTEFNGRMPIGPGTLPSTETVAIATQYGTDEYTIGINRENLPNETLNFGVETSVVTESDDDLQPYGFIRTGNSQSVDYVSATIKRSKVGKTNAMGDGDAIEFNQLPPCYGVWFIKKTARRYYRV